MGALAYDEEEEDAGPARRGRRCASHAVDPGPADRDRTYYAALARGPNMPSDLDEDDELEDVADGTVGLIAKETGDQGIETGSGEEGDEPAVGPAVRNNFNQVVRRKLSSKGNKFVNDGGRGRDSDDEDSLDVDGEFLIPDGVGEESENDDDEVRNGTSGDGLDSQPTANKQQGKEVEEGLTPEQEVIDMTAGSEPQDVEGAMDLTDSQPRAPEIRLSPSPVPAAAPPPAAPKSLIDSQEEDLAVIMPPGMTRKRQAVLDLDDDSDSDEEADRHGEEDEAERKRLIRQQRVLAGLKPFSWDKYVFSFSIYCISVH